MSINTTYQNQYPKAISATLGNSIITTPYEKVLSYINEAKLFINSITKTKSKLIRNLEWSIKIITSHSLYKYELKENEIIEKYKKENKEFKQFVDFVTEYNEEVIQMNKKTSIINTKNVDLSNEIGNLLQVPSVKLKKNYNFSKPKKNNSSNKTESFQRNNTYGKNINNTYGNYIDNKLNLNSLKQVIKFNSFNSKKSSYQNNLSFGKSQEISSKTKIPVVNKKLFSSSFNYQTNNNSNKNTINKKTIKSSFGSNNNSKDKKLKNNYRPSSTENNYKSKKNRFLTIEEIIITNNINPKQIIQKDFNIFDLKKIVGYENVLPIMGKVILEAHGLNNDKIISTKKLDKFLISISNQYFISTLYHNAIHGADVTQTTSLFFLNSNAEQICDTNALDLLSIIIAALGHDIGHPGLTNAFHINAKTDMALTYNDISCLENFHASKLFNTIKNDSTNIFENLNTNDYKTIRKRIVSEILATDMANHGKVMSMIKSKIPADYDKEKHETIEILSKNEKTKFEEQQILLDFFIHSADLAHNTKLFKISIKWVELLTNEFWNQGDKEKNLNLPVSFLCDRNDTNVPNSQVGFIKGFILPTFDVLITLFPTLSYTVENAKNNLNEWQKLGEENHLKGWTPREKNNNEIHKENGLTKKENGNSIEYNGNNKGKKTYIANWGKPKLLIVKKGAK
jgi:hypothetical protein